MNSKNKLLEQINNTLHKGYGEKPKKGLVEEKQVGYPETKLIYTGALLLYKFDKDRNVPLFPFFADGKAKSMCDYMAFYVKNKTLYIFLLNLKSTSPSNHTSQLAAGHTFAHYLIDTVFRCHKTDATVKIVAFGLSHNTKKWRSENYFYKKQKQTFFGHKAGDDFHVEKYCI